MKRKMTQTTWILLLGLCIIRSSSAAGINNIGGVFLKPVSDELQVGIGTLSLYFSISSLVAIFFMPIAGKIIHRFPIKIVIFIATLLQAGSFAMLSFFNSIWAWYLLSIPIAIGGVLLVNILGPILIHRHFYQHSGLALGILMSCAGLLGAILQPTVSASVVHNGWRNTQFVLGLSIFVVVVVTTLFTIHDTKKPEVQSTIIKEETEISGISYQTARKSNSFYGLLIFLFTLTAFGALQPHSSTLATTYHFTLSIIAIGLSLGMVGSCVGAILIGLCCDRWGTWTTSKAIVFLALFSILSLLSSPLHYFLFFIGCFLQGLVGMSIPVLAPLLTQEFFGKKDYELLYPSVMISAPLASIILLPLYGFFYDMMRNYDLVFLLVASLILVGSLSLNIAWKQKLSI